MLEVGPFKAIATRDKITVIRDKDKLDFAAGELSNAAKLISMAMQYCAGNALPPFLRWDQFEVKFLEDGNHILRKIGYEGGVVVTQNDGDNLINLLGDCLNSHVDSVRLTSGPRRGAKASVPDPIIIGRE